MSISSSKESCAKDSGISPSNLFMLTSNQSSCERFPNSGGSVPDN